MSHPPATPPAVDQPVSQQVEEPPVRVGGILLRLGPGLIIAGSIVGSGELIATTPGPVEWDLVLVMSPGALIGGAVGGRLAGVIKPNVLRVVVVAYGVVVSIVYFLR